MEKLKKLHFESLKDIGADYEDNDINLILTDYVSKDEVAELSAKITTDVAIEFLTFVEDNYYFNSGWYSRETDEYIKRSDLFQKFINNHYGK